MKTRILFILLMQSVVLSEFALAQITFQKTYGGSLDDVAYCVKQTFDGGYIVSGSTRSYGVAPDDVYLIRTDGYGDVLWTRTYGKPSPLSFGAFGNVIEQTSDSGFIIACYDFLSTWSTLLIKTNSIGDTLWTRNYRDVTGGYSHPYSIEQTNDGGYMIGTLAPGGACLIKTDANGDTTWTKKIGVAAWGHDYCAAVRQTSDGGYVVATTSHTFSTNIDFVLARTDYSGDVLWSKVYGSTGDDLLKSVHQTADGGFIMAGYTNGFGTGGYDGYLIKTDSLGGLSWSMTYGTFDDEFINCVHQTNDGGFIVGGTSGDSLCVIKTDSNGQVLWSNLYLSNPEYYYNTFVEQTSDSGFIICNVTANWLLGVDIYLIKTDANGNSSCGQNDFAVSVTSPPTTATARTFTTGSGCSFEKRPLQVSSGGSITESCLTIGIDQSNQGDSFNVYPNPANERIIIDMEPDIVKTEFRVFNAFGELQYSAIGTSPVTTIDIASFSSGVYILEIKTGKSSKRVKFLKQ